MDRREALKYTALLTGSTLSAGITASVLKGCTSRKELNWQPVILSVEEAETCGILADVIIPRTDTPGALDVGVDQFIDLIVEQSFETPDRAEFSSGLKIINDIAGKPISQLSPNQIVEVIKELDESMESEEVQYKAYRQIKSLTLLGYFTSEEGMKLNFEYKPVPGRYDGCVPFEPGDKVWIGNHVS